MALYAREEPDKNTLILGHCTPIQDRDISQFPKTSITEVYHPVLRPSHYNKAGIECIEAIEASMTREEFLGYLKGSVMKYIWRYRYKHNPKQDLDKMNWYSDRLIKTYGKEQDRETQA